MNSAPTSPLRLSILLSDDVDDTRRGYLLDLLPSSARVRKISLIRATKPRATTSEEVNNLLQDPAPDLLWSRVKGALTGLRGDHIYHLDNIVKLVLHQLRHHQPYILDLPDKATTQYLQQQLNTHAGHTHPTIVIRHCNMGAALAPPQQHVGSRRLSYILMNIRYPNGLGTCQCGRGAEHHLQGRQSRTGVDHNTVLDYYHMFTAVTITILTTTPDNNFIELGMNMADYLSNHTRRPYLRLPRQLQQHLRLPIINDMNLTTNTNNNTRCNELNYDIQLEALTTTTNNTTQATITRPSEPTGTYPTDSRMRQKEKESQLRAAGKPIVKKVRFKTCAPGDDDCGEGTTPLDFVTYLIENTMDLGLRSDHAVEEHLHSRDLEDDHEFFLDNFEGDLNPSHWLYGSEWSGTPPTPTTTMRYGNMQTFLHDWAPDYRDNKYVDVMEICGGTSRTSYLLLRRWHREPSRVGLNFDAIVGFDLLDSEQQNSLWHYVLITKPTVIVMATPCTSLAGWKSLNAIRAPEAHARSRRISLTLGELGGQLARHQLHVNRHFVAENPVGSDLWETEPWPQVLAHPSVVETTVRMCAAGMKQDGVHVLKPTAFKASTEQLLSLLRELRCNGRHRHVQLQGNDAQGRSRTDQARVWPWDLAAHLASGIATVVRQYYRQRPTPPPRRDHYYFPTAAAATGSPPQLPPLQPGCIGCTHRRARDNPRHNRHPDQCRYPHDNPTHWSRSACAQFKPREHDGHTLLQRQCKWATAQFRRSAPRHGHHPRDPRRRAADEATSALRPSPAHDAGRTIEIRQPPPQTQPGAASSSSSSSATAPHGEQPQQPQQPQPSADRHNPHRRDASTQDTSQATDWSSWDLSRGTQLLRSTSPGVVRRTLRTLHIRWWHATEARMKQLLRAAGTPGNSIAHVDEIVDTCRPCRTWQRPPPSSATTSRTLEHFNEVVQHDLLFVSPTPGRQQL